MYRQVEWLVERLTRPLLRPHEDEGTANAKRVAVTMMVFYTPLLLALLPLGSRLLSVASVTGLTGAAVTYVGWYRFPRTPMEVLFIGTSWLAATVIDYNSMKEGDRTWSVHVALLDCALVMGLSPSHLAACVAATAAYLVIASADRATTMLYAHASTASPWICACADPPCLQPASSATLDCAAAVALFLIDFTLTRGFAEGLRQQMAVMQHSVDVTEAIAQELSMYEVDEARALLAGERGDRLPAVLKAALHRLLNNLDQYRPYLPDAMLMHDDGLEESVTEPPGLGQDGPQVTICFTDVQSSTELWETYPQAMHTALQQHNTAIRRLAQRSNGYEVKVIGDAFMLAFKCAEDACRFGIEVQAALMEVAWPRDLLLHPLCKPASGAGGQLTWNGLRVRAGLHCGSVRVEKNPVTGRCDYFGPPVNVAARVEACLRHGGLTGVTRAVLEGVTEAGLERLGGPVLKSIGQMQLKGVGSAVEVVVLLSRRLAGRSAVLDSPQLQQLSIPRAASRPELVSDRPAGVAGKPRASIASANSFASDDSMRRSRTELRRRTATCVSFRAAQHSLIDAQVEGTIAMLEAVSEATDSSQGVMVSTLSTQCTVVWNGPRPCHDHYSRSLGATDRVRAATARVSGGACTGEVLFGSVPTGRKKHAAVIGGPVELSAVLAELAEQSGVAVLAATSFGKYCTTQGRATSHLPLEVEGGSLPLWIVSPADDGEECDVQSLEGSAVSAPDASPAAAPAPRRIVLGVGMLQ